MPLLKHRRFDALAPEARRLTISFTVHDSSFLAFYLQVQSGFTSFGPNFRGPVLQVASFKLLNLGLNDFGEVTTLGFEGWYWGALPGKRSQYLLPGQHLRIMC